MTDINKVLKDIVKKYGEGAIMILGNDGVQPIETTSTGILALDLALGGGFPQGRLIELYGPQMSGKTSVALFHLIECQQKFPDKMVAYIDMEQALNPTLALQYGVDMDRVLISQPSTGEEALDITEALVRSKEVSCIVVDSVSALLPSFEDESDMSQNTIGLQARMMSKACRKLTPIAAETGTTIIFINQIREKVGAYGNPETTSGGKALGFYASVRVELRMGEPINRNGIRIGHEVRCRVVKNKVAPPFRQCSFNLIYGKGVDRFMEATDLAIKAGIIKQAGAWLTYEDGDTIIKEQGRDKFSVLLAQNPDLYKKIHDTLLNGKLLALE